VDRKKADKAQTIRPARSGRRPLLATGLAIAVVAAALVGYWAYRAAADLPGVKLVDRTATRPKVAHFDWADTGSRLHVTFLDKGDGRSLAAVQHARLADAAEADRMRAHWRAALAALKTHLENGAADA